MSWIDDQVFIPLHSAAPKLGVPAAWLKREAEAGRVPVLMAGRAFMFNVEQLKTSLMERAKANGAAAAGKGGGDAEVERE
jgi:hypothetical protein